MRNAILSGENIVPDWYAIVEKEMSFFLEENIATDWYTMLEKKMYFSLDENIILDWQRMLHNKPMKINRQYEKNT